MSEFDVSFCDGHAGADSTPPAVDIVYAYQDCNMSHAIVDILLLYVAEVRLLLTAGTALHNLFRDRAAVWCPNLQSVHATRHCICTRGYFLQNNLHTPTSNI